MKTTVYTKPIILSDDLPTKTSEVIKVVEDSGEIAHVYKYKNGKYVDIPLNQEEPEFVGLLLQACNNPYIDNISCVGTIKVKSIVNGEQTIKEYSNLN